MYVLRHWRGVGCPRARPDSVRWESTCELNLNCLGGRNGQAIAWRYLFLERVVVVERCNPPGVVD